jgi:hypothetical protein
MAFELTDFYRSYVPRGEMRGLFNVARSDEDSEGERYYAFYNEVGSYVFQQITTSGTAGLKLYKYYAVGANKTAKDLTADWTNRASLIYVEYYQLFNQNG